MTSTGSCLIIEVSAAEPAVRPHRERLDASARLGIPAHITVLAPFMTRETADAAALAEFERLLAETSRFRFRLDRTDWFGDEVLWLAPRDDLPPRPDPAHLPGLPRIPPFEGRFDEVIPHLTIGHGHPVNDLRAAENSVQAHLPIDGHADAVTWITQKSAGAHWVKGATFTLA